jgi:two-component system response regulator FixJ
MPEPGEGRGVYLIDDDEAARESLSFLLRTAGLDVRTYDSAVAFLREMPDLRSACVITDVRMPDMSGIDLLRHLRELKIDVPVIVITGHADVPLAVEAMKVGATEFLEKPFDDDAMLACIRTALDEQRRKDKVQANRAEVEQRLATLSHRERNVLDGLVKGLANKQIAFAHGISPRTVEIYRANLMTKMQAASVSDLVRMALLAGLLDGVEPS